MKKLLLLNASVRKQGTSACIIEYMVERLLGQGIMVRTIALIDIFDQKITLQELLKQIKETECVGVISCCYVNTLPYPSIEVLEQLASQGKEILKGKKIFAIAHGGMPYLDVHEHCLSVCKCFAEQMQMEYIGGVIRGLTPIINGARLDGKATGVKKIVKGLDLLIDDVIHDRNISPKVQDAFNINIPRIINYPLVIFLNHIQKKERKAKGVINFDKQTYLDDDRINS